jgi:hypothetical protein
MIARLSPHIFFSALLVALMLATPVAAKNKNNGGQQINAGLTALGAGPNTVAGPGYYEAGSDGNRSIYLVGEGLSPMDVCITLRNPGPNGRVKLNVFFEDATRNTDTEQLRADLTESRCYAGPIEIRIECAGSRSQRCNAYWRIDRF